MKSKLVSLAVAATIAVSGGAAAVVAAPSFAVQAIPASQTKAYPVLTTGAQGNAVKVLQRLLNANGARLVVDGSFGDGTAGAVRTFQKNKGLAVDGSVGPATWSRLVQVVQYGDRGPTVVALQQTLGLTADGSFGPATRAAVVNFQSANGLARDGVAGPATWGRLIGAASVTPPKPTTRPTTPPTKPGKRTYVALSQMKTGRYGDVNCGPTSATMALLALGKKPEFYQPGNYAQAVDHFRVAPEHMNHNWGGATGSDEVSRGLRSYGVATRTTNMNDALAAVKSGKMVISNGYSSRLPWTTWTGGGHYILVAEHLGGTSYRVFDPASGREHTVSEATLRHWGSQSQPDGHYWRYSNQIVVG